MTDIIICKKDIENLGRKLLKEVQLYFNNDFDYVIPCEDLKIEQEKFFKYLNNFSYYDINENCLKKVEIKSKIDDENLNIDIIFNFLNEIKIDDEIDGDLFYKKKAFLNIYSVFYSDYTYLYD